MRRVVIAGYLAELERLLPAGRRRRAIVAEVRDHLLCAVDDEVRAGRDAAGAEAAAVARAGSARELARRFVADSADVATRLASRLCLAMLVVLGVVYTLLYTEVVSDRHAPAPFGDDPITGVIAVLATEVALVAGAVTMLRALRSGHAPFGGAVRALVGRGVLVTTGATAIALGVESVAAMRHGREVAASTLAAAITALCVVGLGLGVAVALAGATGLRRAGRVTGEADAAPHIIDEARTVLASAVWTLGRRAPRTAALLRSAATRSEALLRDHHRLAWLLDMRRRPWRFCAGTALAAGALFTVAFLPRDGWAALAGGVTEAAMVVVAFATLGGVLGLRPPLRIHTDS